jgi:hypothetical protein
MTSCLRSLALTRTPEHRLRARLLLGVIASIGILALGAGWSASFARADGDPASDVLATQALFLPQDADVTAEHQAQLGALVSSAQRSGYPIRVALIASPTDLGSVAELWREPQSYAAFLGQELSLIYRGQLVVIMPDGFGVYRQGHPIGAQRAALASLQPPGSGDQLATAGLAAVARLAAAAGHVLAVPHAAPVPGAGSGSGSGSSDVLPWIVFVLGASLIALAWAASLRARPLRGARVG